MAAGDLCTRDQVRRFLVKPTGDTGQDTLIDDLIARASKLIAGHCEREFTPTADATRTFYYDGSGYLSLAPYDLRTVASITFDVEAGEANTVLTAAEYRLFPLPAPDGVFQSIRFQAYHAPGGTWPQRTIAIRGAWGFAAVPEDVQDAAIKTVAIWLRRDAAAFESTFRLDEERIEHPKALPSAVFDQLDEYRRRVV